MGRSLAELAVRVLAGVVGSLTAARYGLGIVAWRTTNKLERPSFDVLQRINGGKVEVRRYPSYIVAEATFRSPPTMKAATSNGFRQCARYIFGGNRARRFTTSDARPMAMTAPVRVQMQAPSSTVGDKSAGAPPPPSSVKVSFVMAGNETLRSLPVPKDAAVVLRRIPAHTAAFVRFSGPPPTDKRVARERAELITALGRAGVRPASDSETLVYGYHDPFITPNLLRRNEVGVMVAE